MIRYEKMARLMALDVGEARIGVAVSDAMRFLASPYTTLHVSGDEAQTWAAIQRCIEETEAEGLVIGLPISLDGQIHAQGKWVQDWASRLKQHIAIPLTFWDERLSTVEAQRLLAERDQQQAGKRQRSGVQQQRHSRHSRTKRPPRYPKGKGQEIDALAAAVMLQEYLDSQGRLSKY